ncbi:MAG: polysaccharide deacetylase family protein [Rudaea sp.]
MKDAGTPGAHWQRLDDELGAWRAAGRTATLWLRDDDAGSDSPALRRLLRIAETHRVPVCIAAIPDDADRSLVDAIGRAPLADVAQHGYAHRNHSPPGARSAELGGDRDVRIRIDELRLGRERLRELFIGRYVPVLVPPWNRIGEDLLPHLAQAGFVGLSRFGPRRAAEPAPGLTEVNAHVDPIAWRRDAAFVGDEPTVDRLVTHLRDRREGRCDAGEPTGVLTHHLAFPDAGWRFLDAFLARTRAHPAVEWCGVRRVFGLDRLTFDRSA